jgi:hypothetical protein
VIIWKKLKKTNNHGEDMETSKFIEVIINPFYALVCEMVSEDIDDFQECLKLNTLSNRMKDEYETFKCYTSFKYAVKERHQIELGCEDGIELVRLAKDILLNLCETRDLLSIKEVVPQWLSNEGKWGWTAIHINDKETA